jgi:hypothetical protein
MSPTIREIRPPRQDARQEIAAGDVGAHRVLPREGPVEGR